MSHISETLLVAPAAPADVYRKISWRIMPFIVLCYLCGYLDRVNVGFAKLQMLNDLHMSDAVYGLGAGIFFIGYFIFEVPSNLILHRVGARLWRALRRLLLPDHRLVRYQLLVAVDHQGLRAKRCLDDRLVIGNSLSRRHPSDRVDRNELGPLPLAPDAFFRSGRDRCDRVCCEWLCGSPPHACCDLAERGSRGHLVGVVSVLEHSVVVSCRHLRGRWNCGDQLRR